MGDRALPARAILLLGFCTFLRPSNLVTTTDISDQWAHTLRRADITVTPTGLKVKVNSTKTTSSKQSFTLPVYPTHGAACPVTTWIQYIQAYPAPPAARALVGSNSKPLKAEDILPDIKTALLAVGFPHSADFTLHSLRRSGSRSVATAGATKTQVMKHGGWRSRAVHTYVPPHMFKTIRPKKR